MGSFEDPMLQGIEEIKRRRKITGNIKQFFCNVVQSTMCVVKM